MATMKNLVLPILTEISTGEGTRVELHGRCKDIMTNWPQFKRIFSSLLSDGLVERKWSTMRLGRPDQFVLTKKGKAVVQSI